jgi:methylase of polypeptide subunit release factors
MRVYGWDISKKAVELAVENLRVNTEKGNLKIKGGKGSPVQFDQVDIFSTFTHAQKKQLHKADIIISNPPYISKEGLLRDTTRSVRNWEPRLALVPELDVYDDVAPEDVFYKRLIHLHAHLSRPKILIMEIGDLAQALRVANLAMSDHLPSRLNKIEIWKDWPEGKEEKQDKMVVKGVKIPVRGEGKMRAVVVRSFDRTWPAGGMMGEDERRRWVAQE